MHLDCQSCGASLLVDAAQRTAVCPYCASPSVVERPASADRPAPAFTVAFTLTREAASLAVRGWLGRRSVLVKSSVKRGSIDSIRGVYVPAYLYSAMTQSTFDATIGENYQVTETYTTTDAKGNTVVRTRTVTKTEHRPLQGRYATYVMDVIVTASRALQNLELEAIEPFDLRMMRRYAPALLSGWIAEEPTMTQAECVALARGEALARIGHELDAFMPGDSHHGLTYQTSLDRETIDLVHVPVWVLAIRHDPAAPPLRVLINGQTGAIHGKAPLSWIKITLAVLLGLLIIASPFLIVAIAGAGNRPGRGAAPPRTAPVAQPVPVPIERPATAPKPALPSVTGKPAPAGKPTASGAIKPAPTGGRTK